MVRSRKTSGSSRVMWGIAVVALITGAYAFSSGLTVQKSSQFAVGAAADIMCQGGADAKCKCKTGFKPGTKQCDGKTPGGGKIGCSCSDSTSGDVAASGKCATVGKCLADKADGMTPMLPMLPMLPMPMPKMPMPSEGLVPQYCPPENTASSTARDPNCIPNPSATGSNSSWLSSLFGSSNTDTSASAATELETQTGTKSGSAWASLLTSLGLSSGTTEKKEETTNTSGGGTTFTGGTTATITSGASGGGTGNSGAVVSNDLSTKSGSTFSYTGGTATADGNFSGVLNGISSALQNMLTVVRSWF